MIFWYIASYDSDTQTAISQSDHRLMYVGVSYPQARYCPFSEAAMDVPLTQPSSVNLLTHRPLRMSHTYTSPSSAHTHTHTHRSHDWQEVVTWCHTCSETRGLTWVGEDFAAVVREGDVADVTVYLHTADHLLRLNTHTVKEILRRRRRRRKGTKTDKEQN